MSICKHLNLYQSVIGVVAVMLLAAQFACAQESGRKRNDRRQPAKPHMAVGQESVDFELPLLAFEKDDEGNDVGIISTNLVKLSSFRGEKVVCIFSSSYT